MITCFFSVAWLGDLAVKLERIQVWFNGTVSIQKLKVHLRAKTKAIDQEECSCLKIENLGMCFDTCDLDMNLQDGIMTWLLNNYVT